LACFVSYACFTCHPTKVLITHPDRCFDSLPVPPFPQGDAPRHMLKYVGDGCIAFMAVSFLIEVGSRQK
jgi:hypothetical protein